MSQVNYENNLIKTIMTEKLNILFVDDEKQILIPLKAIFKKQYKVFTAVSGSDALNIIRSNLISIIVSDQRMPEMPGIDLLKQVKEISPLTVRILLTGYADLNAVVESVNTGEIFRFIEKPWNNERLKKTIETAANISLKLAKKESKINKQSQQPSSDIPQQGSTNILVIDDALDICAKVHHFFGHQHSVFCANSLTESLTILKERDIAVLLTETVVQGEEMSGLIHVLKDNYPSTVVVVLTTQADAHLVVRLINEGQIFRYLPQPVENHVLEFSINAALKRHAEFRGEPALLASQQFIEKPDDEQTPDSEGKLTMLRNKLKSMRKLWN
jgi:DNA-binding NtrC family response regulator